MDGLAALRFSYLRRWSCTGDVARTLNHVLIGKVLALPGVLGPGERDELVDLIALFLDLPLAHEPPFQSGYLYLLSVPVDKEPVATPGAVIVCERRRQGGMVHLDLPQEMVTLRDAIIECLGRQFSGTPLRRIAAWTVQVSDSPATAIHFADGVMRAHAERPFASDADLFAAGLSACLEFLLRGVDGRVMEWALAVAAGLSAPEKLVGTEAALLGREAGLRRAFEAGLVESLGEHANDALDFRKPLAALGMLSEMPGAPTLDSITVRLLPEMRRVFERARANRLPPLRLAPPQSPARFVGRAELLQRLVSLLEPGTHIRTCIIYGPAGIGKTALAARTAELLASRSEPVWISFAEGPRAGWARVADAIGLQTGFDEAGAKGAVPSWVVRVKEKLRGGTYLWVFDNVDGLSEEELPAWLPSGRGAALVLVVSRRSQRPLQHEQDAIALRVPPMSHEDARAVLSIRAPSLVDQIRKGDADAIIERVGAHPLALNIAGGLLSERGIEETRRVLTSVVSAAADSEAESVRELAAEVVRGVSPEARELLSAIAVSAPSGTPLSLAVTIAGLTPDAAKKAIDELSDRALIERDARLVRMNELVRIDVERPLHTDSEARQQLERKHAESVAAAVKHASHAGDTVAEDDLVSDTGLTLDRMSALCAAGERDVIGLIADLAMWLDDYPRADRAARATRLVAVLQSVLGDETIVTGALREQYAWTWMILGNVYLESPTGQRADNLRAAVAAYERALSLLNSTETPRKWAIVQGNLGLALSELATTDGNAIFPRAIDALQAALEQTSLEQYPESWATIQNNLANLWMKQDPALNLGRAIAAFEAARDNFPPDSRHWSQAQRNLGQCWLIEARLGRAESLDKAVDAYRSAGMISREQFPLAWAAARIEFVGLLLSIRDRRPTAVDEAFTAAREAVEVLDPSTSPLDWAAAHLALGDALMELPAGDRFENLTAALRAYDAARSVLSADSFPKEAQLAEEGHKRAVEQLTALRRP